MAAVGFGEHVRLEAAWDSTCGFPGEGPAGLTHVQVDEGAGGWLNFTRGGALRSPSQVAGGAAEDLSEVDAARARGPRPRKGNKVWSLLTANVTAWPRADELVSECAHWQRVPDVIMLQEIARDKPECQALESQLGGRRWQAAFEPSVRTQALGRSAGAAVLRRLSATLGRYECVDLERRHPGRVVLTLWSGLTARGVLLGSVYGYTSGANAEALNQELLEMLAKEVSAIRLPFILGGDWNVSPEALSLPGFATRLKAVICCPGQATYVAGGAESVLDYFVVSESLRPAVQEVRVVEGSGVKKHRPVEILLSGRARADEVLVLARPPPRPPAPPITCKPNPEEEQRLPEWQPPSAGGSREEWQAAVNARYAAWAAAADGQVGGLYGQPAHPLRGQELKFVRKPVMPLGGHGPRVDPETAGLRRLTHLGQRFLSEARAGDAEQARRPWVAAMKLAPRPCATAWTTRRAAVRCWPGMWHSDIREQIDGWHGEVLRREDAAVRTRKWDWEEWIRRAFEEDGAARVYRFVKGPAAASPLLQFQVGEDLPAATLQELVELKAKPWKELWLPDGAEFLPLLQLPLEERALPGPLPDPEEFRGLIRSYRWSTAIGCDHWAPRSLAMLSDQLIKDLVELCAAMILHGVMPTQLSLLLVVLIPKTEGGERPIGIFPTVLRLLDRWYRWSYGAQWLKRQPSRGFFGARGSTVEDAVWRQGLLAEWSHAVGKHSATYLLDIRKAFEHITHQHLWEVAGRHGFSRTWLAWLIGAFRMQRRLQVIGGVSEVVCASRSVVPGSSFADILMRMAVMEVAAEAQRRWPLLSLASGVDDLQGTSWGQLRRVKDEAADSCEFLVQGLAECGLPVSQPKVQLVGTDGEVLKQVARRSKTLQKAQARSIRNLGADFAGGRRVHHKVRAARVARVVLRARRLRRLGRFGRQGLRIARTAFGPAAFFAAAISGVLPGHLRRIRAAFHSAAVKKPGRRSVTVDLALLDKRAEPARVAYGTPIGWLAKELSSASAPRLMIRQCLHEGLRVQDEEVAKALAKGRKEPCCIHLARGPVSAAVAAARRIGWRHVQGSLWQDGNGGTMDFENDSAAWIKDRAESDAVQCMWRQAAARHAHLAHLDGEPFMDAAVELFAEDSLTKRQAGLLRALLAGAFFRSSTCVCGETFGDALQWWEHYAWHCPCTQPCRDGLAVPQHVGTKSLEALPDDFVDKIRGFGHLPWVRTAWLPDPRERLPGPAEPPITKWDRVGVDMEAAFAGDCFGDESCTIQGKDRQQHCRAGWAIVEAGRQLDGRLALGRTCAGTLPGRHQSSERAAVYTLLTWLRNLVPWSRTRPRLFLDNQRTVDGWHGRWDTVEPWALNRDLWLQVDAARADGRDDATVLWVKGHSLPGAAGRDKNQALRIFGNKAADLLAREAAGWHPASLEIQSSLVKSHVFMRQLCNAYVRILDWAVQVPERLPAITPLEQLFPRMRPPPVPDHCFASDGAGTERCVRCMLPPGLCDGRPCRPHGKLGHSLVALGSGLFCNRCGVYSFTHLCSLGSVCNGRPIGGGSESRLARMRRGKHPRKEFFIGQPRGIDTTLGVFCVMLGG